MTEPNTVIAWSEPAVLDALRARYAPDEWCFLAGVRKCTGFSSGGTMRTADAVAMGMYPSRGMALVGFEVKTARGDWLRELKDPAKAETIFKWMDHWYLATPEGVARKDEIPEPWGWLAVKENGDVRAAKTAPKLERQGEPPRSFWASLFREAMRQASQDAEVRRRLEPRLATELEQCRKDWQLQHGYELSEAKRYLESYKGKYNDLISALGGENYDTRIVDTCKVARLILKGEQSVSSTIERLRTADQVLKDAIERVAWARKEIEHAGQFERRDGQDTRIPSGLHQDELLGSAGRVAG